MELGDPLAYDLTYVFVFVFVFVVTMSEYYSLRKKGFGSRADVRVSWLGVLEVG